MGEYAKLRGPMGGEVKIGTCEDMLYLRFDQRHLVTKLPHSVDPIRDQEHIRYRFPWPDEDTIEPGAFSDPFRKLWTHVPPPEMEHGIVQFVADGYNVCLPCPEGPDAGHGLMVHRNGFAGPTALVQQRVWEGRLVGVMECRCGHRYRLPTVEDVLPVCEDLLKRGGTFFNTVATRLRAGYDMEV